MRSLLVGILLSSTAALAQPADAPPAAPSAPAAPAPSSADARPRGNGLSLVLVEELPEACRDLGNLADSPSANQALSARISLASCIAEQRVRMLILCDCEQSVVDIQGASAQSIALLDEVIQVGEPAMKILALQTKGDLLASFATRILASVPPIASGSSEAAVTLRDTRLALIQPLVAPWQAAARSAYQELETIARANPQLAKNAAVLAAVRASRVKLAQLQTTGVAKR